MIIKAIRLEDFRQFKGKQNIDISTDEHKNVTLIHAENSVGKTTILNAILWCFFERTTGRFEQKAEIVNFEARSEGKKTAYVEIIFLSDDQEYEARRVYDSGTKKSELRVRKVDPSGAIGGAINYPDILIREVLPEQMAPYFFFDGEQAENYASESGGSVIAGAIRDIMGSKLIEQAISDLDETRKYFNRQVGNQSHDSQIEQLQREYEVIEKKCDEISVRLPNYKTSIESIERQIDDIEKGLRGIERLKTLQEARYQTEKSIRDVEVEISKLKRKIVEWIPDYGRALLARGLVEKCVEVVAKNSAKGVIPAPYNQKFVEGVLAKMICICGHDIKDNSDEYRAIYSLMDKASSPVIESIIVRLQGRTYALEKEAGKAEGLLKDLEKSLGTKKRNLDELQQRLLGLNEDIQKSDIVGVSEREASRSALKIKLKEIVGKKSTEENEKVVLESRKCKIMDDIHKVSSKNIIARKFLLRRDVALQAAEELKEIKQLKENEVRQYIEKEVNVILQKYARRDYKFVLDVNYRMMLVNRTGGMAPKSSGENQLVSLAFLSALISFAKKRIKEQKGSGVYIPATLAPLVLDSPFGQLDKTYRSTVADFVSRLAPQVIILVSSSQGNSEVIESLENRIGAEYVLVHHDRSTQGTKKQDVVHRYGKEYVTSFYDEPCSMTVIKRIDA